MHRSGYHPRPGGHEGRPDRLNLHLEHEHSPVLVFRVNRGGEILELNAAGEAALGRAPELLKGRPLAAFVDPGSRPDLERLLSAAGEPAATRCVAFLRPQGTSVPVLLAAYPGGRRGAEGAVWLVGLNDAARGQHIRELESRAEMLAGFIDASSEAMWCLEYTEPVDLTRSVPEIIRQVFENECHWRMCNAAMARLYNLPEGLDFNRQPVSTYFRRTPENESFVRQLIEARFNIDGAQSFDHGHDGRLFCVENTVRAHIEDGLMHRMWGTVRDITRFRSTVNALTERTREVTEILSALPDAVLVVDLSRRAIAVNPAFETTFGWSSEAVLGKDVSAFIDLEAHGPAHGRWFGPAPSRWRTSVRCASGEHCPCDVRIAPLPADSDRRFVMSLRPLRRAGARRASGRVARRTA